MERVKEKLSEYVLIVKNDLLKQMLMHSFDQSEESKMIYLKYSVLSSWFGDVNSYDEFKEKYDSFINLVNYDDVVELFKLVKRISTEGKTSTVEYYTEKEPKIDEKSDELYFVEKESIIYKPQNVDSKQLEMDRERIDEAKKHYNKTINSIEYSINSKTSGYSLPTDYEEDEKYLDYSLHKKVMFVELLKACLIKIDKFLEIKKNELMRRYGLQDQNTNIKKGK